MMQVTQQPVDLFYSYAHEDEVLRDELDKHLKIMERRGVIRSWHDRKIVPGTQWAEDIDSNLSSADLILLLISADFFASDYIWSKELATALKRHESGDASVVPVMLKAYDIEDTPLTQLQGLPTDLRPVTSWPNRDEAWTDVAKGIRRTVAKILAQRPRPSPPPFTVDGSESVTALPEAADFGEAIRPSRPPRAAPDPLLSRVIDDFAVQVERAAESRGTSSDRAATERAALTLLDVPDQKRVLWVDDRPSNNRVESAALAKLQIEVVPVTSTDAALRQIATDPEPFDLVISDWSRPEPLGDAPSAGMRLLRELRRRLPVVFYHGTFDRTRRNALREQAMKAGAFGEAVQPDELFTLVTAALGPRTHDA
jgi:CheY-like chemotaxis protein